MKKILFLFGFLILFSACSNDDPVTNVYDDYDKIQFSDVSPLPILKNGDRITKLISLRSRIFAVNDDNLFISENGGEGWEKIDIKINQNIVRVGKIYSIDGDQGDNYLEERLYLATASGVFYSDDLGESFQNIYGGQDPVKQIEFIDHVGWVMVGNWGLNSGINTKVPGDFWRSSNGNLPYEYIGVLQDIVVDPLKPDAIAYTYGFHGAEGGWKFFQTMDRGLFWREIDYQVIYSCAINNTTYIFSYERYSDDDAFSWSRLKVPAKAYFYSEKYEELFMVENSGAGIYYGFLNGTEYLGLNSANIKSIYVHGIYIYAVLENGKLLRGNLNNYFLH